MFPLYDYALARHRELVQEAELDAEIRRRASDIAATGRMTPARRSSARRLRRTWRSSRLEGSPRPAKAVLGTTWSRPTPAPTSEH